MNRFRSTRRGVFAFGRRVRLAIESRTRQGWARVHAAALPILIASVAAGVAYALARIIPGHEFPFFAGTAAWVCIGFTPDRQIRKVAELALGVTMGVAFGDLFASFFGSGPWQITLAIIASALVARFVDRGLMVTAQAGVQAVVVVGIPGLAEGGPFDRVLDAAIGGLIALAVVAIIPGDIRRRLRAQGRAGYGELCVVLDSLAQGLKTGDLDAIEDALERGRRTQPVIDEWNATVRSSMQATRVSPSAHRHLPEIERSARACRLVDQAMRTSRVLARRAIPASEIDDPPVALGEALAELSSGARRAGEALGEGLDPEKARPEMLSVAARLDPDVLHATDPAAQTLVHLTRSIVIDVLESTGMSYDEARAELPELF